MCRVCLPTVDCAIGNARRCRASQQESSTVPLARCDWGLASFLNFSPAESILRFFRRAARRDLDSGAHGRRVRARRVRVRADGRLLESVFCAGAGACRRARDSATASSMNAMISSTTSSSVISSVGRTKNLFFIAPQFGSSSGDEAVARLRATAPPFSQSLAQARAHLLGDGLHLLVLHAVEDARELRGAGPGRVGCVERVHRA